MDNGLLRFAKNIGTQSSGCPDLSSDSFPLLALLGRNSETVGIALGLGEKVARLDTQRRTNLLVRTTREAVHKDKLPFGFPNAEAGGLVAVCGAPRLPAPSRRPYAV